jgi:cellulose 1,4-beta-cellobiosidase
VRDPNFNVDFVRSNLYCLRGLILAAILAAAVWGCQGPDAFFRQLDAGTSTGGTLGAGTGGFHGGSGGLSGSGGAGTGGKVSGSGGKAAGTGGTVLTAGTGGTTGGTGGGTGGVTGGGTGGAAVGTGGAIVGTGGTNDDAGGDSASDAVVAPPCTDCLQVLAETEATATDQQFKFVFQLANKTSTPIAYSDITVRYWFKADLPNDPTTFNVDYAASVPGADITGTFGTSASGASQYLQIAFTAAAGALASGGNSQEIQARVNAHDPGWNLTQDDDYSFMGCPVTTTFASCAQITAYVAGALTWGTEPP